MAGGAGVARRWWNLCGVAKGFNCGPEMGTPRFYRGLAHADRGRASHGQTFLEPHARDYYQQCHHPGPDRIGWFAGRGRALTQGNTG